jgi:hypothetical protein
LASIREEFAIDAYATASALRTNKVARLDGALKDCTILPYVTAGEKWSRKVFVKSAIAALM